MRIYIGADHGGFSLKQEVQQWLQEGGHDVEDLGAHALDPDDDYPDYAFAVAKRVADDEESVGILFCRSGSGMAIAANKIEDIRAVEVFDLTSAIHAKTNNDANVICLGADWMDPQETKLVIQNFLDTPFQSEERHVRRLKKIHDQED